MTKKSFWMTIALTCAVAQGARAEWVKYLERSWNGSSVVTTQVEHNDFKTLEGDHADDWIGLSGSYVVKGEVSYKVLNITGDNVKLVLADNCLLNVKHIKLEPGHSLYIYSQSDGDSQGILKAKNYDNISLLPIYENAAAIGGGENAAMGSLYVHGGDIVARVVEPTELGNTSTYGAGIGGGNDNGIDGEVVVYGGKVSALGSVYGAGIGGGDNSNQGGQVVIYGGEVNAESSRYGAGIGGGDGNQIRGNGGIIKIYGGKVTAHGGYSKSASGTKAAGGAGLGGGRNGRGGSVYIYGGEVEAIGGKDAAGIGGSRNYGGGSCDISGGTVFARGGKECAAFFFYYSAPAIGGGRLEGPGSNVRITGGKVTLAKLGTGSDSCPFIGGGIDSGDDGSLTIEPGMKMSIANPDPQWDDEKYYYVNSSMQAPPLTLVDKAAQREGFCRSRDYLYAVIEPCTHEGTGYHYTTGSDTHSRNCNFCNYSVTESHAYDEHGLCVCGKEENSVEDFSWGVTLYRATAAGTTNFADHVVMYVAKNSSGQEFSVPAVSATQGLTLMGYLQTSTAPSSIEMQSGEESQLIKVGDVINVMGTTTLYPRYRYRFKPTWEWADDNASAKLTLTLPGISGDVVLQSGQTGVNGSTLVISSEDIKDENSVKCGTRYTATATYKRENVSDYIFTSTREVYDLTLSDTDNNDAALTKYEGATASVTLGGRTLYKDGTWNTLCLPFTVADLTGTPLEGGKVKELDSAAFDANGTLTLTFKDADGIVAGMPYLIKWENASGTTVVSPQFNKVIVSAVEGAAVQTDYVHFIGSFSPVTLEANDRSVLYLGDANTLYWPSADVTVGACRAIFQLVGLTAGDLKQGARSIVLDFGDNETGISEIVNSQSSNSQSYWYSLDGRKLNGVPTAKGIYLNHGKVVIKK